MTNLANDIESLLDEVAGERVRAPAFRDKDGDTRMGGSDAGSDRSSRRDKRGDDRARRRSPDRHDRAARDGGDYWEPKGGRNRSPRSRRAVKSASPELNDDERDRRTIFVQQLAARLRTKDLTSFFEKVGPVKEAQIVKDRVSGRSKGVGYVEFRNEASVAAAIQLTGQKLLGIPIIAQHTEAEKNRQARTTEGAGPREPGVPIHRLYVGNIHFSITEADLTNVFEPFGTLEFVQLQKEEGTGRSRGYGFVQFEVPESAKEALEKMNGFDLAGRPIRVGLGNDKFTAETTERVLQKFPQQGRQEGSSIFGVGGRGTHAGGDERFGGSSGRNKDQGQGHDGAIDYEGGVAMTQARRQDLMNSLLTRGDPADAKKGAANAKAPIVAAPRREAPPNVPQASRCIKLHNVFDAEEEEAASGPDWAKELTTDLKTECEDKYGKISHISLDPNTGEAWIKFEQIAGGQKAMKGLNGRFFAGRTLSADFVVDAVYSSLFGRARAG
ncbi:hypothetical protein BLS_003845 [Venturia inaequalis]|uniref:RRM domain-containing protein n=1 Tax=Venturia inaequalis TaxID=5025 RepID=A0A8H3V9M6_VENIN|nr:hypothetical protein BLS_003845 [Venturia inaequalis]